MLAGLFPLSSLFIFLSANQLNKIAAITIKTVNKPIGTTNSAQLSPYN